MLVVLLAMLAAAPAQADGGKDGSGDSPSPSPSQQQAGGSIGIRLLEASANRRDDARAYLYIVDHMNPGATISRRFEVSNTSNDPHRITVYPGAAVIRGNHFVPAKDPYANELSSWITIDKNEIIAPPHSRVPLTATISVPDSASRGKRYGAIWAQVASPKPGQNGNIQVVNRVGIRVYLDVGPGGDPPSDFEIEKLTPGRTEAGLPVVRATVKNTGERALDLTGRLWLSEGPGGLNAGPYAAQVGTTVAPGKTAPVKVILDEQLPDGPWETKLALQSGRVKNSVNGTLTFPGTKAAWGLPASLNSPVSMTMTAAVALGVLAGGFLMIVMLRRNRGRRLLGAS